MGFSPCRPPRSSRTKSPLWEGEAPAEPKSIVSLHLSLFAQNRRPGIPDARDKSRSLGFSPGTNFSSPLKSPVFFDERGRAGMLGLHFVPRVIPARPPPTHTKPTTRPTFARRSTNPYTDYHSTNKSLGIITALLLRSRNMGFSPCHPPRSSPPTGQPLAQADEYCRLRLSGCINPGTEAAASELFANPIKLQPTGAHIILH